MRCTLCILLFILTLAFAQADDARRSLRKGLSAYALEHFSEAAEEYEKAFSLKPDPALLYNAAQAHRLAGNNERALKLYRNFLRIFGKKATNKDEVNRHIHALEAAVETQHKAQTSPPVDVAEPGTAPTGDSNGPPAAAPATAPSNSNSGSTPATISSRSATLTAHPADQPGASRSIRRVGSGAWWSARSGRGRRRRGPRRGSLFGRKPESVRLFRRDDGALSASKQTLVVVGPHPGAVSSSTVRKRPAPASRGRCSSISRLDETSAAADALLVAVQVGGTKLGDPVTHKAGVAAGDFDRG